VPQLELNINDVPVSFALPAIVASRTRYFQYLRPIVLWSFNSLVNCSVLPKIGSKVTTSGGRPNLILNSTFWTLFLVF